MGSVRASILRSPAHPHCGIPKKARGVCGVLFCGGGLRSFPTQHSKCRSPGLSFFLQALLMRGVFHGCEHTTKLNLAEICADRIVNLLLVARRSSSSQFLHETLGLQLCWLEYLVRHTAFTPEAFHGVERVLRKTSELRRQRSFCGLLRLLSGISRVLSREHAASEGQSDGKSKSELHLASFLCGDCHHTIRSARCASVHFASCRGTVTGPRLSDRCGPSSCPCHGYSPGRTSHSCTRNQAARREHPFQRPDHAVGLRERADRAAAHRRLARPQKIIEAFACPAELSEQPIQKRQRRRVHQSDFLLLMAASARGAVVFCQPTRRALSLQQFGRQQFLNRINRNVCLACSQLPKRSNVRADRICNPVQPRRAVLGVEVGLTAEEPPKRVQPLRLLPGDGTCRHAALLFFSWPRNFTSRRTERYFTTRGLPSPPRAKMSSTLHAATIFFTCASPSFAGWPFPSSRQEISRTSSSRSPGSGSLWSILLNHCSSCARPRRKFS